MTTTILFERQNTFPLWFFLYREYINFPNILQLCLKMKENPLEIARWEHT